MCYVHYQRNRRYGDPTVVKREHGLTDAERFWQYVEKGVDCWLWTGAISHTYGNFCLTIGPNKYRFRSSHRSYSIL